MAENFVRLTLDTDTMRQLAALTEGEVLNVAGSINGQAISVRLDLAEQISLEQQLLDALKEDLATDPLSAEVDKPRYVVFTTTQYDDGFFYSSTGDVYCPGEDDPAVYASTSIDFDAGVDEILTDMADDGRLGEYSDLIIDLTEGKVEARTNGHVLPWEK